MIAQPTRVSYCRQRNANPETEKSVLQWRGVRPDDTMIEDRVIELEATSEESSSVASEMLQEADQKTALWKRKLSLRVVLKDSVARTFFAEFLSREHAGEVYDFYRHVEEFRKEPSEEKRRVKALFIYNNFISPDGDLQVFISFHVSEAIKAALSEMFISTELFAAAQREVLSSLRCDNFGRFCTSAMFDMMLSAIDGRAAVVDPIVCATFLELSGEQEGWNLFVLNCRQ
jgi:hypothetical protein